ncbi:MAG: dihydroneopterin aldolase [Myxococcales bacterium]|nr:MAG: dihydroneopterin aldolase [Myxococcales bacterium]
MKTSDICQICHDSMKITPNIGLCRGPVYAAFMTIGTIRLSGLELDALLGVYTHELDKLQTVQVDLEMQVDIGQAAYLEKLKYTVGYAQTAEQVRFLLGHCRYRLLETGAQVLLRCLLSPPIASVEHGAVLEAKVTLKKPGALDGFGVPSLSVTARPSEIKAAAQVVQGVHRRCFHDGKDALIYRLDLKTDSSPIIEEASASMMVLSPGIQWKGDALAVNAVVHCTPESISDFKNTAQNPASVLIIERRYVDARYHPSEHRRDRKTSSIFPMF